MEKEKVTQLRTQAERALELASEERMRPAEDVVAFSICHNSRVSIRMYLISYLLKNGVESDQNESMKSLLERCSKLDERFSKLDISEIECGGSRADKNDEYCLSINKVGSCFDTANAIKQMIKELD